MKQESELSHSASLLSSLCSGNKSLKAGESFEPTEPSYLAQWLIGLQGKPPSKVDADYERQRRGLTTTELTAAD